MIPWTEIERIAEEVMQNDESYKPDPWQKKVLAHQGDIVLRSGRQVGKSETIGKKAAKTGIAYESITILMIAAAQRQSSEIFQKTLKSLLKVQDAVLDKVGQYKDNPKLGWKRNREAKTLYDYENGIFETNPTRTECLLKNGTRILSLPTGKSGAFVRCYTVDVLIADEAAFIPEPVWTAVKPMLATSKQMRGLGWTILLSTPFGRGGYYYECCHDPDFLQIHVSSEDCKRIARDFLRKEKTRLSKMEYAQEYLGEFVAEFNQFFQTELIKSRMTFIEWKYTESYTKTKKYYLGLDIARYGADENAFIINEMDGNKCKIVYVETSERKSLTDTVGRTLALDQKWNFAKILTDDSGIGGGVTDMLIEKLGKHRILGINNARKTIEENRHKGILKEDLYSNALRLMEKQQDPIEIISDMKLLRSLRSMTFEYTSEANLRIFGKYSHLAEAFVRACWAVKAKSLKLFMA